MKNKISAYSESIMWEETAFITFRLQNQKHLDKIPALRALECINACAGAVNPQTIPEMIDLFYDALVFVEDALEDSSRSKDALSTSHKMRKAIALLEGSKP